MEGFSFTFRGFSLRAVIKNVTVEGARSQWAGTWQQRVNWAFPSEGDRRCSLRSERGWGQQDLLKEKQTNCLPGRWNPECSCEMAGMFGLCWRVVFLPGFSWMTSTVKYIIKSIIHYIQLMQNTCSIGHHKIGFMTSWFHLTCLRTIIM